MADPIDLHKAQRIIVEQARSLARATEAVPLGESCGRTAAQHVRALQSIPAFPRASMDGYAVRSKDIATATSAQPVTLEIIDTIPAGRTDIPRLRKGQAIRIMTGAAIPAGADQVIPMEKCSCLQNQVIIKRAGKRYRHIRKTGSQFKKGQVIARKGCAISPELLSPLAEAGVQTITAHQKPHVALLCTGSELLEIGSKPRPGKIISGNRLLLNGLLQPLTAEVIDLGIAPDDVGRISGALISAEHAQIVITTGGMGPGDYDLMKEVYNKAGINIHYDALNVRPGRSTMFGSLGKTLYFALPGPPPAVFLLFHELIKPAILALQNVHQPLPKVESAYLNQTITLKKTGILNLRCGVVFSQRQNMMVRPAQKNDITDCIIIVPQNRRNLLTGERVNLHRI